MHQIHEPVFQFFQLILLTEPLDLFGLQIAVGHLYTDLFQPILGGVYVSIALGLGQMDAHRLPNLLQLPHDSFDLVNDGLALFRHDPVRPPLHLERKAVAGTLYFQQNLSTVSRTHPPLDLAVDPAPLQHGVTLHAACRPIVNVPFPQNKFYQITD